MGVARVVMAVATVLLWQFRWLLGCHWLLSGIAVQVRLLGCHCGNQGGF